MPRYVVSPIATAECVSLIVAVTTVATDNLETALWHARHNSCVFGAGILDRTTGEIDVGYGFGIPCPSISI